MTGTKLSNTESIRLVNALNARLQALTEGQFTNSKHQRTIRSILSKITAEDFLFTSIEKRMCRSCIIENLPVPDRRIAIDDDPTSLFTMRNLQDYADKMDMGKDMLVKFGYKKAVYFQSFDFSYRYRSAVN